MFNWLKIYLIRQGIKQLDQLEAPIALKIREAQQRLGEIPPEPFAKELVDEFQSKLYDWLDVPLEDRK